MGWWKGEEEEEEEEWRENRKGKRGRGWGGRRGREKERVIISPRFSAPLEKPQIPL